MGSSNLTIVLLFFVILALVQSIDAQNSPQDFVDAHNSARAAVGVGQVAWSDEVAAYAQNYANQRSGDCQLIHSTGGPYGENLFKGSGADYTGVYAVNYWVAENQYYDYNSNTCAGGECRHYTQVVWAATTAIGCARVICNDGGIFITCNYNPPGNYVGQRPY